MGYWVLGIVCLPDMTKLRCRRNWGFYISAMYTVKKCFAVLVLSSLWSSHELELHSQACRTEPSYYWSIHKSLLAAGAPDPLVIFSSSQFSAMKGKKFKWCSFAIAVTLHLYMALAQVTVVSNQGNPMHYAAVPIQYKRCNKEFELNTPSASIFLLFNYFRENIWVRINVQFHFLHIFVGRVDRIYKTTKLSMLFFTFSVRPQKFWGRVEQIFQKSPCRYLSSWRLKANICLIQIAFSRWIAPLRKNRFLDFFSEGP